ncbi:MAG: co-chaperone DjlA [Gammaproteobacteria bacterium]|nr:co-chaperone DjlA [Gammaproteobacteria bacterium]
MSITGKLIGGVLGLMIGNIPGLLFGLWIGHSFDKGVQQNFGNFYSSYSTAETQQVFFDATFAVMGHLAKADGVVTKIEIQAAEQIMQRLGITGEKRAEAIAQFNLGKSDDFDLQSTLNQLLTYCRAKPSLIQMFLEVQIFSATSDGKINREEMDILYTIGSAFRVSRFQIDLLVKMVMAQQSFRQGHSGGYSGGRHQAGRQGPTIDQAYQVLGISSSASKQEVKKAYRKLMSQHHPDKLVSKGMPEEMVKMATEKSQEIQSAYDMIKKHKGF